MAADTPPAPASRNGTSVQAVADAITGGIKRGRLAPGQRLVESDLMRETGATRAKVREALRQLQVEGLVTIEAFRGASVRRLAQTELGEIYAVREALEGMAARLAAARAPTAGAGALVTIQAELDRLQAQGDALGFADANQRWHDALVRLADNRVLEEHLARLKTPIFRLLFQSYYSREVIARANTTLKRVTDAVSLGAPDEAEARMREHVRGGLAVIEARADLAPD